MENLITLENIVKRYAQGRPNEFTALHGVSLAIRAGSAVALQGPSGSGKTTLLSLLGCMSRPTEGRIHVGGQEITSLPERFLVDIRRKRFGFIFQKLNLIKGISVLDNVMIPVYPTGEDRGVLVQKAYAALEQLEIADKAKERPEHLSGGQAQRVAIARAVMNDPDILLADEPTAHLDSRLAEELMGIFSRLKASGKTLIIASHDPLVAASPLIDTRIILRDGRIAEGGGE